MWSKYMNLCIFKEANDLNVNHPSKIKSPSICSRYITQMKRKNVPWKNFIVEKSLFNCAVYFSKKKKKLFLKFFLNSLYNRLSKMQILLKFRYIFRLIYEIHCKEAEWFLRNHFSQIVTYSVSWNFRVFLPTSCPTTMVKHLLDQFSICRTPIVIIAQIIDISHMRFIFSFLLSRRFGKLRVSSIKRPNLY